MILAHYSDLRNYQRHFGAAALQSSVALTIGVALWPLQS
jgi:hypothetical protein